MFTSVSLCEQATVNSFLREYLRILILYVNYVENVFHSNFFYKKSRKSASNVDAKDDISILITIIINASVWIGVCCVCRNAFAIQIVTIKNIKPYNFFFISCHIRNFVVQIFLICSSWNRFSLFYSDVFLSHRRH